MKGGFKVIDCDRHVVEPYDMWDKYLEAPFKHYNVQMASKYTLGTTIGGTRTSVGGVNRAGNSAGTIANNPNEGFARNPIWRKKFKNGTINGFNPKSYLEDMDVEGVDIAVCFTGIGLYATWGDTLDPDLSAAMCRAYNNWLYDFMSTNPDRLKGVCLLPLQDIELATQELRRCATELGMVGIFWRPNPHMGRLLSDTAYDPVYAIAEEHGLNVSVHEGINTNVPFFTKGRVETSFAHHATCHPTEQMGAVLAMTAGGVFDRFPKLTASFLESGAGWLPYWLERLDYLCQNPMLSDGYQGKENPSEYFKRGQGFVSCEAGEETLPFIERTLGKDYIMWASDYPHTDAMIDFPNGLDSFVNPKKGVSFDFIRKLLWSNPARCFHMNA